MIRPFAYHRPDSVQAAVSRSSELADARFLAGGMTLIPAMKHGLATPCALIDLNGLAALKGISASAHELRIGAMTRHAEVAASGELRERLPALAQLAAGIGDAQVRHRGTIGGSVANNDPAADYPSACLALGATIATERRSLAAEKFFNGFFATALEPGELIVSVRFPLPLKAAYAKFAQPASRYAMVGVFVAMFADSVRVAVTGAGRKGVFRVPAFEQALRSDFSSRALGAGAIREDDMISDLHASAAYRAHLVLVMARRAVDACNGVAVRRPTRHGGAYAYAA